MDARWSSSKRFLVRCPGLPYGWPIAPQVRPIVTELAPADRSDPRAATAECARPRIPSSQIHCSKEMFDSMNEDGRPARNRCMGPNSMQTNQRCRTLWVCRGYDFPARQTGSQLAMASESGLVSRSLAKSALALAAALGLVVVFAQSGARRSGAVRSATPPLGHPLDSPLPTAPDSSPASSAVNAYNRSGMPAAEKSARAVVRDPSAPPRDRDTGRWVLPMPRPARDGSQKLGSSSPSCGKSHGGETGSRREPTNPLPPTPAFPPFPARLNVPAQLPPTVLLTSPCRPPLAPSTTTGCPRPRWKKRLPTSTRC